MELVQHFTPLIPLHRHHSQLLPQLNEPDLPERLRQDISKLVLRAHMINVDAPFFNTVSNKVIPCVYMFASFMVNRILTQGYSRLVIN
jgi:hypothetical protein